VRGMDIVCIGGGPGGLYFGILMKKADPTNNVTIYERNRADDTFGFGVVFSDATLEHIAAADTETYARITESFSHWDDIDVHHRGEMLRSTGHGFSGLSRKKLLEILRERCDELGVVTHFSTNVPDVTAHLSADLVVAADGVNSGIREQFAEHFQPSVDWRPNRFMWLGTTRRFPAFTFYFGENEHGLFRVHAYNYDDEHSTFIVECTEETWRSAGLEHKTEAENAAYCADLFADELEGHPLLTNRSIWRRFPTISCGRWSHENLVLLGDAVHTAHFSIGSGTKLAMEDGIALCRAVGEHPDLATALHRYEEERRPAVDSLQRAAQVSLDWFENTERYHQRMDPMQFTYSLLTRSMRINHTNLRMRDPEFTARVDRWFSGGTDATPPMFAPITLRGLTLSNRVMMSPMCQYSATDGNIDDWHLVHLGSRALGGAGLIMTEMTDVSADARITPGCAGMYTPEHVQQWKRVVDFVHGNSATAIGFQVAHAGRKGATKLMWEGIDQPLDVGAWPLLAASALPYLAHSQTPKSMDRSDMDQVIADFVSSTQGAEAAGFDLLELHMAHGYLLAGFLSPLTNVRTDAYGGSLENRMRFPLEVFDAARAAWPAHKPISVRISATDWAPGGFEERDAVAVSQALKARGCDIIDVSTGQTVADSRPSYGRLYQTPFSETIRLEAEIPTITVGGVVSYGDVNSIIASGRADICALARAHLYDPYWTRHAAYEQGVRLEWPDQYKVLNRFTPRFEWSVRANEKD